MTIQTMQTNTNRVASRSTPPPPLDARWSRLAHDFDRLPRPRSTARPDVGALLMLGHDDALAQAESYVVEGHTTRTGELIDCDDVDDEATVARCARRLDRATAEGLAPPVPAGFWIAFLHWRTPVGMVRAFSSTRMRIA
jgi:hypothetical protein